MNTQVDVSVQTCPPSLNDVAGQGSRYRWITAKKHWYGLLGPALAAAGMTPCRSVYVEGMITFPDRRKRDQGNYRVALAKEITRLHSQEGVAWSSTADLARGDEAVARLKLERDIAVGVREALAQAVWRATADRKDAQRFSDWSMRVETVTATQDDSRLAWSRQAA